MGAGVINPREPRLFSLWHRSWSGYASVSANDESRAMEPPTPGTDDDVSITPREPVDARGLALTVLAVAAAILLARYMQEVLIPFVLAGLVFYALDPLVDRLQRLHVPRPLGAGLAVALVVGVTAFTAYTLLDDALKGVEELPVAARSLRARWAADREPGTIEKMQDAAREIEKTAAAASSPGPQSPAR